MLEILKNFSLSDVSNASNVVMGLIALIALIVAIVTFFKTHGVKLSINNIKCLLVHKRKKQPNNDDEKFNYSEPILQFSLTNKRRSLFDCSIEINNNIHTSIPLFVSGEWKHNETKLFKYNSGGIISELKSEYEHNIDKNKKIDKHIISCCVYNTIGNKIFEKKIKDKNAHKFCKRFAECVDVFKNKKILNEFEEEIKEDFIQLKDNEKGKEILKNINRKQ